VSTKLSAEVLYDSDTKSLWLEYPDSQRIPLGWADNPGKAYDLVRNLGLRRVGSWVPMYGRLRSCLVVIPEEWSPPTDVSS
jgi:hypothetical protein